MPYKVDIFASVRLSSKQFQFARATLQRRQRSPPMTAWWALSTRCFSLHKSLAAAQSPSNKESLQRQIDSTNSQIDRLVYDLYGLTDHEVKLVDGTTGS